MEAVSTAPIDRYLRALWDHRGSDLLLVAGAPPTMRIDGELVPIDGEPALGADVTARIVSELLGPVLAETLRVDHEIDFSFGWERHARFRGNAFHQRGSVGLALRLIADTIPSFADLGLPPIVAELAAERSGLVLVTGPTGSGKSTTLAAMVKYISQQRACHILTIEDPIEFHHKHSRSIVTQREVGSDSDSFAHALRSALRESPDVLLIGEMRDAESIEAALNISETGHLVLATLHTNDAAQAVNRIIDVFPADSQAQIRVQLASALVGVLAQRLMPRLDGGRVAAFEVLLATPAVRALIRGAKAEQLGNVIATSQRQGMQTLDASVERLVSAGIVAAA